MRSRASSASRSDSLMCSLRLSTMPVIAGKPHLARIRKTMPKMTTIQNNRPVSGVIRFMP